MKDMAVERIRNFALLGHTGSGKTTLIDTLLHRAGVHDRLGSPEAGTSAADWTDEERERKISIWTKPFELPVQTAAGEFAFVVLDTPGYADFAGQVAAAVRVADAGVLVVDAGAGLQVGTYRAWRLCENAGIPRAIVVNGLDRENADFDAALASIQEVWGRACLPVTQPAAGGGAVVDLAGAEVPEDGAAAERRVALIEMAAETDDALMEKYLGGEALTPAEIAGGLRRAVAERRLVPVFATAAKSGLGVEALCEGLTNLLPAPHERPLADAGGTAWDAAPDGPPAGLVWRSIVDPFVGQLSLVRVFGGALRAESEVFNVTRGQKERIGGLLVLNGKKQEPAAVAVAGRIVAIPKLKHTRLNDTLAGAGETRTLAPVDFPNPVTAYAVTPKTQGDEDKLAQGLSRVAEEDPTLRVERNTETHELILSGMGDVQLNVAVEHMKRNSRVEVDLHTPKVAYKETITGTAEGHYKHKKQSGGRGQYGEVYLRVAPRDPSDEEWFEDAIVGGAIPHNFMPAVQKGLVEGLQGGPLAGAPVEHVKVTVYDGSYHEVDSSEVAFKIAASRALRDGLGKARPVLLEPIMKIRILVPETCMGDVTGDLNHKRGRILGMGAEDGMQVITAEAPQAELFQYSSQLRSVTGGRGTFEMEFSRMETVPSNIAQRVMAAAQKAREDEE